MQEDPVIEQKLPVAKTRASLCEFVLFQLPLTSPIPPDALLGGDCFKFTMGAVLLTEASVSVSTSELTRFDLGDI